MIFILLAAGIALALMLSGEGRAARNRRDIQEDEIGGHPVVQGIVAVDGCISLFIWGAFLLGLLVVASLFMVPQ